MGSTLEHGIYLPSEGEKNCYQGLAGNWNKVDGALGDVAGLKQLIESKFTKEIVTELPTEDINPFCIYMILKTDPETDNVYDEWVYINNNWEYLGNTKVDMTQYYTKQEVNQLPAVASGVTATKVGNYDAHIANGDIHVTASDKAKWNTVALIKQLRLVNTQVGSATTIAFANIDDTNGIKVGDKCMDLDAKLFEITAVDTTNQTVTVGTALIDLALDANVVHTSGNENVGGIKNFTDYTYIRALNFTNEVASPSSSGSAVMPIVTTVTYTDSSPSQSARLNFRITADGTKSLYPHENNQYALGLQSRKWSEVRAIQYYYGSSDVEFSNKFVTTDTNQDISANKNFKGLITTVPDATLWPTDTNTSADITSLGGSSIHLEYKASGKLTDLSGGAWSVVELGEGCFFFRTNNGTDIRYKHFPTNLVNRIPVVSGKNRFINDVTPDQDNTYKLGSSSLRWATINGLNPSSLGMPDLNSGVDISSYLDTSQSSSNSYTPSVNGWISIKGRSSSAGAVVIMQGDMCQMGYGVVDFDTSDRVAFCMLPVTQNVQVTIWLKSITTIDSAKFYPCLGNV